MAQEKQTVYVFNDGSWQSDFLQEELKHNDSKNLKTFDTPNSHIKDGELSEAKYIDFRRDYLNKIGDKAKDKGLVISLHFTSEDYAKRNNDTEDSQDLGTQINFLRAEYPNIKILYGYQFHDREKLRRRFMLPDDKGKMSAAAEAMRNRRLLEKKKAKEEKFKEIESQAAKEHEFDDKRRKEKAENFKPKPQVPEGAGVQPTTEAEEKTILDTMQEQGIKVPTQEIDEESEPNHTKKKKTGKAK